MRVVSRFNAGKAGTGDYRRDRGDAVDVLVLQSILDWAQPTNRED
jgi:hypothetical protein